MTASTGWQDSQYNLVQEESGQTQDTVCPEKELHKW